MWYHQRFKGNITQSHNSNGKLGREYFPWYAVLQCILYITHCTWYGNIKKKFTALVALYFHLLCIMCFIGFEFILFGLGSGISFPCSTELSWVEFSRVESSRVELSWTELTWVELRWNEMGKYMNVWKWKGGKEKNQTKPWRRLLS